MKRKDEPNQPRGGSGGARALSSGGLTVLHIDDDPNDTELLQAASRQAGVPFVLQHIQDGEQAIAYISGLGVYADRRRYPLPTLIILDLKMPRTSGFEVLKSLRKHPQLNDAPVVVLSGSERQDDIQLAYRMGANSYIVKPLGFKELVQVVETLHTVWLAKPVNATLPPPAASAKLRAAEALDTDLL
jgi:CheY-like chemotaxis protein